MELIKQGKTLIFECEYCGCKFKALPGKDYIYSHHSSEFKTSCPGCNAYLYDKNIVESLDGEEQHKEEQHKPNKLSLFSIFGIKGD